MSNEHSKGANADKRAFLDGSDLDTRFGHAFPEWSDQYDSDGSTPECVCDPAPPEDCPVDHAAEFDRRLTAPMSDEAAAELQRRLQEGTVPRRRVRDSACTCGPVGDYRTEGPQYPDEDCPSHGNPAVIGGSKYDAAERACPTPLTHNWGCGCPTDQAPAADERNDRRECYEEAIKGSLPLADKAVTRAMAVADAEHSELLADCHAQVQGLAAENARLRADFERVDALMDSERERADFNLSELESARDENARLRAELRGQHNYGKRLAFDLNRARDENAKLRDALTRIESNIKNGGASDAHLIRSIQSIVKGAR